MGRKYLVVSHPKAHFHCDHPIQAILKQNDKRLALLIQPREMNSMFVANCDCGYDLNASDYQKYTEPLRLFHRRYNLSGEANIRDITVNFE